MRVIFEIGEGSVETGFPVRVRIGEQGRPDSENFSGRLPPALLVKRNYENWQTIYRHLPVNWLITLPESQITNVSTIEACNQAAQDFLSSFNEWLNKPSVRQLERRISRRVDNWKNTRFILQTQDSLLQRLPWHLWDFFQLDDDQPEIVVSPEYELSNKKLKTQQLTTPVKILAVLGYGHGIDIQQDLQALGQILPGAIIEPLREPSCPGLRNKLWTPSWDILFFAGHSCSQQDASCGEIQINANESLPLDNLRNTLKHAVQKGLKLAIFNSCDGLGLARNLADARISYTIVMREPVPDIIAQHFLEYFLTAFAAGESLYASVQQARARLQEEWENQYPCASWLPVIFQNTAAAELKYPRQHQQQNWKKVALRTAIVISAIVGFGMISWRVLDEFQSRARFSDGNKILVKTFTTSYKQEGVKAYRQKNYKLATSKFQQSLQQYPNDPETLIYLNNSKIGHELALTIGVPVPIGTNPNVAQEILRGVAQAQQEINNQGGMNGKLLKVKIANDDNNPDIAVKVADRFVQDKDNILAVVGHNSSDASLPASDKYQARKLVMISPTSSSTRLTDRPHGTDGNYIYRTVISFTTIADALAEYAKTTGKNRISTCNDSNAADQSFKNDFEKAIAQKGGQLININCDFASKNFQPKTIIKNAKDVDAILLNPQVNRMDKAIALAKENQGKITLLGNPSLQTKNTLAAGDAVNGMVVPVPWHGSVSPDKNFVQNAYKLWGDKDLVTWRTATAFDATQAIAAAFKQKDTREGVQQALSSGTFSLQGATGTIKFLPSGDRVGNAVLVEVKRNPKASTGYSFEPKDSMESRISLGEKILVQDNPSNEKQLGVQAFAAGDYDNAIAHFQASVQKMPNDPESRIYLLNASAARSAKILKIAVSVPIGSNLNVAKEILQGVAQAQDEVNKQGGIRGHLLQVEIASDGNNRNIAEKLANSLVADQKILAVIAHNGSDASVVACPIYQQRKLVNIYPTLFSFKLLGCGSYIFRTAPNIRSIAEALSSYAINNLNQRNLAICVDGRVINPQSLQDEFSYAINKDGGKLVNITCDFSALDFNPNKVITDAIKSGADGLVLAPHVDRINKALDLAAANKGRLKLFGSPTLYTSQTLQQGRSDVNGLELVVPWHPEKNLKNNFAKNAQQLWGSPVTWRSATSYDAAVAIISGLQQSTTREELQKVLHNPNFSPDGATGKIQFSQSGVKRSSAVGNRNIKNDVVLVKIKPSSTSPTGYKFFLNSP
ncbi:ABC transporter substrate-binding protein [Brasilonema octagenarum]|uniref:ABC transporter substrate-binding protein n=1 Tax=Brasilonema octagenarum UFV-OR1 TaxID=417115 RepID=A0ABX1M2Y8_9CYAN|nr:ABC transporter substrate-binding protein [Brasilonema octagenarum]NMF62170.1 ABC transporter substrate-binding protein [Brasilonema octagenarum UFV-OR1]